MFAGVYREMAKVGLPDPRRVDELEIWEIAVLLGIDESRAESADRYAHLRARVAHEQGMGPKPEWGDPTAEELELMSTLSSLGGSSL